MGELAIVATIQGIVAVLVLVLGSRLNAKVRVIREQVQNGHTQNMREEGDDRHAENIGKLDRLLDQIGAARADVQRLKNSLARAWDQLDGNTDRIWELEHTCEPHTDPHTDTPTAHHRPRH